jgi:hypothetical protein
MRSWPHNKVGGRSAWRITHAGAPKMPSAIASSVRRRSSSLIASLSARASAAVGSMPAPRSAPARTSSRVTSSPRTQYAA